MKELNSKDKRKTNDNRGGKSTAKPPFVNKKSKPKPKQYSKLREGNGKLDNAKPLAGDLYQSAATTKAQTKRLPIHEDAQEPFGALSSSKRLKSAKEDQSNATFKPETWKTGAPTVVNATPSRLDKYKKKLEGAKFRLLNESLYTGQKVESGLTDDEFAVYHQGFDRQVSKWPTNPVDVIIDRYLRSKNKKKLDVGDFGCGSAKIAERQGKFHNVHSFDLVAANERVVACDIARDGVPMPDDSLDMVIFSLSLMDERPATYIKEARRVLRTHGSLIIAEVKSRFALSSDDSETSLEAMRKGLNLFCTGLDKMGFTMMEMDAESNTMFVLMRLQKRRDAGTDMAPLMLKPCEYKRR